MSSIAEEYSKQILACLMRSLPQKWDSAELIFRFDKGVVSFFSTFSLDNRYFDMPITPESECSSYIDDVATCLQLAMYEQFGSTPISAIFKVRPNEDIEISFIYDGESKCQQQE